MTYVGRGKSKRGIEPHIHVVVDMSIIVWRSDRLKPIVNPFAINNVLVLVISFLFKREISKFNKLYKTIGFAFSNLCRWFIR